MGKWTKADIKRMTLSSCYVCNRPLDFRGEVEWLPEFRKFLDARRVDIVVQGLEINVRIARERAAKNEETAAHFETHPTIYGAHTPEMVERFRGLVHDELRAVPRLEKLIARIKAEGLPPEVLAFDPTKR